MWDLDSYTKQMYEIPWEEPLLIDWVQEERLYKDAKHTSTNQRCADLLDCGLPFSTICASSSGLHSFVCVVLCCYFWICSACEARPYTYSYKHYAEPRHATEAITTAADTYMRQHADRNTGTVQYIVQCWGYSVK